MTVQQAVSLESKFKVRSSCREAKKLLGDLIIDCNIALKKLHRS